MTIYEIIKKPVVNTEKSRDLMMKNEAQYTFEVDRRANKLQIKEAVEKLFNVEVVSVNTLNIKPKMERFRMSVYKTQAIKKAVVTLKEGQKIAAYEV